MRRAELRLFHPSADFARYSSVYSTVYRAVTSRRVRSVLSVWFPHDDERCHIYSISVLSKLSVEGVLAKWLVVGKES